MLGNNGHESAATKSLRKRPRTTVTLKQQRFCKAYVANGGNGQEAARTANYKGNDKTLKAVACENLTKPYLRQYLGSLAEKADHQIFRRLMSAEETLARTTFLASASLDLVLDDNGQFDILKARETGGIHALKKLKVRNFTRRYKDGTVEEIVTTEMELRDKNGSLELMGKHHNLWTGEIDDPDEVLSRILGYPKALLPAHLDEPDAIDANGSLTLAQRSTELSADVALDTNREHDLEKRTDWEDGKLDEDLNQLNQQVTNGQRLERQVSATYDPTPQEFPVSNPLTPSQVELDEKASVGNTLKGYRKLNRKKPDCP